jgi:hypothetical protein
MADRAPIAIVTASDSGIGKATAVALDAPFVLGQRAATLMRDAGSGLRRVVRGQKRVGSAAAVPRRRDPMVVQRETATGAEPQAPLTLPQSAPRSPFFFPPTAAARAARLAQMTLSAAVPQCGDRDRDLACREES